MGVLLNTAKSLDMGGSKNADTLSVKSTKSNKSVDSRGEYSETRVCGISVEFILSAIGYAVGVGNVWRFPYRAAQNGGGVFLIPYFIMLLVCGIPIFYIELAFGQYSGQGPITIWESIPIFKGIGWSMIFVSWIVSLYYNIVITWSIFYLFASMQTTLPWTRCDADWNQNAVCIILDDNGTLITSQPYTAETVSAAEEYWYYRVLRLDQSTGENDIGAPNWDLTLCNLLGWLIVFVCLYKGVESAGKVVYFTATFPYFVLVILFFFGIFREGAGIGIDYYLTPDWAQLADANVWKNAASQIFYSLGVAFGGLMTMASFNRFDNNVGRDTLIVCIGNCLTSFFAGFVIFSVIGSMSHILGVEVKDLADAGPGLAFIAYPQALALMPIPQLWSILFFLMMICLGLDSQYAMVEVVVTGLPDEFPILRKYKPYILGAVCSSGFLIGLIFTSPGGMYWFVMFEDYSASIGFLIMATCMLVAIFHLYGNACTKLYGGYYGRFIKNLEEMMGPAESCFRKTMDWYYLGSWWLVTPAMLLFIIIFSLISYANPTMSVGYLPNDDPNKIYTYSATGIVISNIINFTPLVILVAFAILEWRKRGSFTEALKPSAEWDRQIAKRKSKTLKQPAVFEDQLHVNPTFSGFEMDDEKTSPL